MNVCVKFLLPRKLSLFQRHCSTMDLPSVVKKLEEFAPLALGQQ